MNESISAARPQRLFTAGALLVAAIAFLASNFSRAPELNGAGTHVLDVVSARLPALETGTWWDLLYAVAVTLAVLGLATLVRGRGTGLVFAGAAVAIVGNLVHAAVVVIQVLAANLVAGDATQMAQLWDRVSADPHLLPLLVMILVFPVGLVVLTAGLVRARMVHWSLLALVLGMTVLDFAHFRGSHDVLAIGMAVYSWALALALVRPSGATRPSRPRLATSPAGERVAPSPGQSIWRQALGL